MFIKRLPPRSLYFSLVIVACLLFSTLVAPLAWLSIYPLSSNFAGFRFEDIEFTNLLFVSLYLWLIAFIYILSSWLAYIQLRPRANFRHPILQTSTISDVPSDFLDTVSKKRPFRLLFQKTSLFPKLLC